MGVDSISLHLSLSYQINRKSPLKIKIASKSYMTKI